MYPVGSGSGQEPAKLRREVRDEDEQIRTLGFTQLPEDVLVHIFSVLDMQSLVSVGLVCRLWNLVASENHLWQTQYTNLFGICSNDLEIKGLQISRVVEDEGNTLFWREAFKRAYIGSKAGKPKVSGDRAHMINSYLSLKEVIALMDDLEEKKEQKAVEHSLNELQLEGEEEEEEEEDGFELCGICSKENDHWTFECPWLDLVPNGATVGSGYGVVCRDCGQVGGHPGTNWTGRAVTTLCCICENIGHWTQDCPKWDPAKYQPPRVEVLMHEEEYVGPRKVSTAKCGGVMHFEELEEFYD